jgi:molybdate transport system substrate-binding protein
MPKFLSLLLALSLISGRAVADGLIVSAAASLTNAFRDAGKLFEAKHPEHKATFNFASSDVLLSQIAKGAPVDVFATADAESMDRAEKQGLLAAGSRRVLLHNALVLVVPASSPERVTGLASLEEATVRRIAIGNPASVPAGRYARAALQAAGSWSKLESKFILAQSVRQALDYVARGEVDAAIVYATDAAIMPEKVRLAATIAMPQPIVYPIAVIKDSRHLAAAAAFVATLESDEARRIFLRHGFRPAAASDR